MSDLQGIKGMMGYKVDIVFCIDSTGSMTPIIDQVKRNAKEMPDRIRRGCDEKGKKIEALRFRVIEYRDLVEDPRDQAMIEHAFTENAEEFCAQVDRIVPQGGGEMPESTLDAIVQACKSDWAVVQGRNKRKIIVVMTDAPPRELHEASLQPGEGRDVQTVLNYYANMQTGSEARLLLIAPEYPEYKELAKEEFVRYTAISPGNGLDEIGFDEVVDWIVNSV